MQSLASLVSSLQEGHYKSYYKRHMERGMHPAEELFAKHALLALAPGDRSQGERREEARYILRTSLESLPPSPSAKIFLGQLNSRFSDNVLPADLDIEEMIFVSNIATCLAASYESPHAQSAEKLLAERREELLRLASVAGREPALPIVIKEGLFWLYYMNRNLRGVCIQSLPGQGLPVVFIGEEYFVGNEIREEVILRIACHEMIHSSQVATSGDKVEGWGELACSALLEAITEGLTVCRIGNREAFSPSEIIRRDYVFFVTALFSEMKRVGIEYSDFPARLEEMNASSLSVAASLLGDPESFIGKARRASRALTLQRIVFSGREKILRGKNDPSDREAVAASAVGDHLDIIEEVAFSGDSGLQIIEEALAASPS